MIHRLRTACSSIICAAAAIASSAPAQEPPPQNDVVVTGERDSKARDAAVRALTRAISRRSDGQLARFSDPVCAASSGFEATYDAMVVKRIEDIARAVGIAIAKPGCRANLTVITLDNGQRSLQALYKLQPWLFTQISIVERRRLLADAGPVHVVTFTELRSRDGARVSHDRETGADDSLPTLRVDSASILNPATRQDIGGAVVLIDRRAAVGKTLRQLADYAAMRTLAKTGDARDGDDSILRLFADPGTAAPREMTAFDRAYLAALYRGEATRDFQAKASEIARGVIRSGAGARTAQSDLR